MDQNPEEDYGVEDEDGEESSSSKFSWRDHWYPVSLIEDLDPQVPTPFQLLGRDIVLWFDNSSSQWVALDDKCPHRLAPLSVTFSHPSFHAPILVLIVLILCLLAKKMEKESLKKKEKKKKERYGLFEAHPLLGFGC